MDASDPASLQNLNDIVLPAEVGWWPLAPGWYFLCSFLLIALGWLAYRLVVRWRRDRYRRAALRELQALTDGNREEALEWVSLGQLPSLLKRTALTAYPREQVASLSGADWHQFLNASVTRPVFTQPVCATLDCLAYATRDAARVDPEAGQALIDACRYWLRNHRPSRQRGAAEA